MESHEYFDQNYLTRYMYESIQLMGWTVPNWLNIPGHRDVLINEEKALCERKYLYKNEVNSYFYKTQGYLST